MRVKSTLPLTMLMLCMTTLARASDLDDAIRATMQKRHIPGASLAVVRNGQIILAKSYGMADLEQSVPVTPQTLFPLGSVGKQFTAMAIMMLAEEGKVDLNDKAGKHLPKRAFT